MTTFKVEGEELLQKNVKNYGNGAHIILPKKWIGENVVIIRTTGGTK